MFRQSHSQENTSAQENTSQMMSTQSQAQSTQSTFNVCPQSNAPEDKDKHVQDYTSQRQPAQLNLNATYTQPFGFVNTDDWDSKLSYWVGTSLQRIPTDSIDELRDIVNNTAMESLTGNKAAIRALKLIPRLLLSKKKATRKI